MVLLKVVVVFAVLGFASPAYAQSNADTGRQLVTRSCTTCHATSETATATDGAPPLSFVARDNKSNPAWIRGWLTDPHPPMPGIMLSRQQIADIIAYLNTLPNETPGRGK